MHFPECVFVNSIKTESQLQTFDEGDLVMIVSAWKGGKYSYGFRIRTSVVKGSDRDEHFDSSWEFVYLKLPDENEELKVKITPSFWRKCPELRNGSIREWLRKMGLVPWPYRKPPKFNLTQLKGNQFEITNLGCRDRC